MPSLRNALTRWSTPPSTPACSRLRADIDKGEAIAWLAANYGIGEAEVAVYGDGGNDIAMLERFAPYGHAYTPYGACDDAKRAASEVIGSNVFYAVPRHMVRTLRGSVS